MPLVVPVRAISDNAHNDNVAPKVRRSGLWNWIVRFRGTVSIIIIRHGIVRFATAATVWVWCKWRVVLGWNGSRSWLPRGCWSWRSCWWTASGSWSWLGRNAIVSLQALARIVQVEVPRGSWEFSVAIKLAERWEWTGVSAFVLYKVTWSIRETVLEPPATRINDDWHSQTNLHCSCLRKSTEVNLSSRFDLHLG